MLSRMGDIRNAHKILVNDFKTWRDHSEDSDIDGKIILKWVLEE